MDEVGVDQTTGIATANMLAPVECPKCGYVMRARHNREPHRQAARIIYCATVGCELQNRMYQAPLATLIPL